jgi:hypothetical protein
MPFGQDYAPRLREEARRMLATQVHGVEEELRTLQNKFAASVAQISQRLVSILDIEIPAMEAILADAVAESVRGSERRRTEEMLGFARFAYEMRRKETQEEILNSLLGGAQRYAPRLALFVTRGNQFAGWSSRGFSNETAQGLGNCVLALSDSPLLHNALEADGLTTANDLSQETALSHLVPGDGGSPWHAFPLRAMRSPVAVLLASPAEGRSCDLESLCILMDITGLCVENMALKILHEIKSGMPSTAARPDQQAAAEPAGEPVPSPAADVSEEKSTEANIAAEVDALAPGSSPAAGTMENEPETISVPVPPIEPEPEHAEMEVGNIVSPAAAVPESEVPEPPVAHESTALSEPPAHAPDAAMPFVEPAPSVAEVIVEEHHHTLPGTHEPIRPALLREVQPLSEEEKLHADAKRFARLLASEIKLYNEQRVLEGRANRDLYVRLKRDIDRSRDMYEKRVSPTVSRKVDYFHDELIRVLGDNDPSTLGSDYPGPRVES